MTSKEYKKLYNRVKNFNKNVIKTEKTLGYSPAQYRFVSTLSRVIFDRGKRRGQLRSWSEFKKSIEQTAQGKELIKKGVITKEDYVKGVNEVFNALKGRTTLRGEKSFQLKRMRTELKKYGIPSSKLTYDELREAYNNAYIREEQLKNDTSYDSWSRTNGWYVLLEEEIKKMKNAK